MHTEDYPNVYRLWKTIKGFGIRSMDDSQEGVELFIRRNPSTSVVAEAGGEVVGAILCGHDGRRGCFYHVCVREDFRKQGIGKELLEHLIRDARQGGRIQVLSVTISASDPAAASLCRRYGFQQIGCYPRFFRAGDRYEDGVMMNLYL